jgi:hypothetical protein
MLIVENLVQLRNVDRQKMRFFFCFKIPDSCLYKGEEDEFIGVALDGYPIYGPNVSDSDHILTSADLDECHGRVINGTYRYHATSTWPYFMGCIKGVVMQVSELINKNPYQIQMNNKQSINKKQRMSFLAP